jgi:hypothetical protein
MQAEDRVLGRRADVAMRIAITQEKERRGRERGGGYE